MQIRSEETRLQIQKSASRLFSQNGYDATGVAQICASAGISKGAFYYHFPSKQALFLVLLEDWLTNLDSAFETIQQETRSVPEAIQAMARMAGNVIQSSDANLSIIIEFWIQAYRDPKVWQAAIAPYHRYLDYFTTLMQKGIQEGSVEPGNPQLAARTIVSIGIGWLLQVLFDPEFKQWDAEVDQSVNLFINNFFRRNL